MKMQFGEHRSPIELKLLESPINISKSAHGSFLSIFRWRPVATSYYANLVGHVWILALVVLLTVEAIFLSDIIISLILPELLALDATMFTIFKVVVYSIPRGVFIALPSAILIGVYLVFLRRRENQEFIISAGFGHGLKPLLFIALVVGVLSASLSLIISGFIEPLARYEFRNTISTSAQKAVEEGNLVAGRFYSVGDATMYASSGRLNDIAENVFIHTMKSKEINQVILAKKTQKPKTIQNGQIGLVFSDANVYEFKTPEFSRNFQQQSETVKDGCFGCGEVLPGSIDHLFFSNFYIELPAFELSKPRERGSLVEATLSELLSNSEGNPKVAQVIGERIFRAALCILAPFIALLALALTFRSTFLIALPISIGVVLVLSFFNSSVMNQLSHYGLYVMGIVILTISVLIITICIALVYKLRGNLIRSDGLAL